MAKRRTLRSQRDKALKELAEYKRMAAVRRIDNAIMSQRYYEQVAHLQAFYDYYEMERACGFIDGNFIKRRLLHDLVNEGHFDQAVRSHTEPIGNNKTRLIIEVNVLKTE